MRLPALAIWLLERVGAGYHRGELVGDLVEELHNGRSRAWFWGQALRAIAARRPSLGRRLHGSWQSWRGALSVLLLMSVFRSAWANWVYVPTGSMNPTILEGDRLLVDKHVYGLRIPFTLVHLTAGTNPRRGDIVTLVSPVDGTLLVKRVVAIPGDTVALDHERLIVNGVGAQYAPGDASELGELLASTRRHHPEVLREYGVIPAHDILLLPDRWAPATYGPVVVPAGMYFVLGDDRDNSADSRYIGFVPRRNIIGRAIRVLVSLDPDRHDLPRRGRLLEPLR